MHNDNTPLRGANARDDIAAERCQWFALCDNPAVTTEPHPILGDVPICERCAAKVKALS